MYEIISWVYRDHPNFITLAILLFNLDFLPTVKTAPRSPDGRASRPQTDSGPGPAVAASKENLPVLNTRIICPGSTRFEAWCLFTCVCERVYVLIFMNCRNVFLKINVPLRECSWYSYPSESRFLDFDVYKNCLESIKTYVPGPCPEKFWSSSSRVEPRSLHLSAQGKLDLIFYLYDSVSTAFLPVLSHSLCSYF